MTAAARAMSMRHDHAAMPVDRQLSYTPHVNNVVARISKLALGELSYDLCAYAGQ